MGLDPMVFALKQAVVVVGFVFFFASFHSFFEIFSPQISTWITGSVFFFINIDHLFTTASSTDFEHIILHN